MTMLKQIFQTPDGSTFDSKADAERHMRRPAIMAALLGVAGGQEKLAETLYNQEEAIRDALDTGSIKRVTKSERNRLAKAIEACKGVKGAEFLAEHAQIVVDSFRWPTQQRLSAEDKQAAQLKGMTEVFEGREDVAAWAVAESEKILAAYKAGQPERVVPQSASEGLQMYKDWKSAEKAMKEAQAAFDKEATPENKDALDAAVKEHDMRKKAMDDRKAARAKAAAE